MRILGNLIESNRKWAERVKVGDPQFFERLTSQQAPKYLWIGCSDSRVPANQIVGLAPGDIFVHRNIANVVVHSDLNCLSVIQYAVEFLKIEHVIVCGHYGCGGVQAALQKTQLGLMENWLLHIRDVYHKHYRELEAIPEEKERLERLCELHVVEQVYNVCRTTIVQRAWRNGHSLSVHGWIYGVHNGLIQDLNVCIASAEEFSLVDAL